MVNATRRGAPSWVLSSPLMRKTIKTMECDALLKCRSCRPPEPVASRHARSSRAELAVVADTGGHLIFHRRARKPVRHPTARGICYRRG
jgi:hypothetical protein